ncbi:protease complex subunit PrcB family protein [Marininema halotolerans]|uniref:PrcB C-terminal n=1 Tax=Marininema halotolerans TaxID=1155944 RepID=A0A1I6RPQ5_9BACL|nr:protease complex subunit PrcB family protein [Marininema halotolerans]SFS66699.1 PrcB C-terminal [Marininema halotolerans]
MRKRKVISVMLGCTLLFGTMGCGGSYLSPESKAGEAHHAKDEHTVPFQQESLDKLPDKVKDQWAKAKTSKEEKGIQAKVMDEGRTYLFLTAGKKNTGGWTIKVKEVTQSGDHIRVNAEEVPPKKGSLNTQAITSPMTVISVKTAKDDLEYTAHIDKGAMAEAPSKKDGMPPRDDDVQGKVLTKQVEAGKSLPENVKAKLTDMRSSKKGGEVRVNYHDQTYLIIGLGERRTSGYRINIDNVIEKDGKVHVYAQEITPSSDGMVTQVITHPTQVIAVPRIDDDMDIEYHIKKQSSKGQPNF